MVAQRHEGTSWKGSRDEGTQNSTMLQFIKGGVSGEETTRTSQNTAGRRRRQDYNFSKPMRGLRGGEHSYLTNKDLRITCQTQRVLEIGVGIKMSDGE